MTIGIRHRTALVAFAGLSMLAVPALAGEEKLRREDLPAAVRKAVDRKFPEAKFRGAAKEVEDGKTTYEVEMTIEGRAVDAILSPEGKILEVEREVPAAKLPAAVAKTLAAEYPGAKIEKAETITKGEDGPVRYEVAIKGTEVVLTPEGRVVTPDAEDDEKPSAKAGSKKDKEDDEDDDDR